MIELKIDRKEQNSKPFMTDYEKGYRQALVDINTPKLAIIPDSDYESSKCPTCGKEFYPEYERCRDGRYIRPYGLDRCPFCGQALDWGD